MEPKRSVAGDDGGEEERSKRHRAVPNAIGDVLRFPSAEALSLVLEPFLREVVQDEVEKAIFSFMNSGQGVYLNPVRPSVTRRWQLQFQNNLPHTLYTGSRIQTVDGSPVKIAIVDSLSNVTVTSGHLSSIRLEVLVLDGDFGSDERKNWTEEEFNDSLVREREGKRPLLTGDLVVTLMQGIGCFGEATFTDNSSWIRSRKFRLGVRVLNNSVGVQEGISGAFLVKDHRGKFYKKHHPPSLDDEVWRLEKIGKDGKFHKRLAEKGINTVQDFLRLLVVNQERLHNILGMTTKIWEATVQHAWDCFIEEKVYYCYISDKQVTLYFNSIFQISGVLFDGSCYQQFTELTLEQKELVYKLMEVVNMDQNDMFTINKVPRNLATPLLTAGAVYSAHQLQ